MLLIPLPQLKESTSLCCTATSLNNKANDFAFFLHRALIKMPFNLFSHEVNAHIAKVSERALLEQQAVSETQEDDTDYMQDGPTEEPGDVVPYRSEQTRYGITSTYAIGKSKAYSARLSDRYKLSTVHVHACVAWRSVV